MKTEDSAPKDIKHRRIKCFCVQFVCKNRKAATKNNHKNKFFLESTPYDWIWRNVGSSFPIVIYAWKDTQWGDPDLKNKIEVDEVELVLPKPNNGNRIISHRFNIFSKVVSVNVCQISKSKGLKSTKSCFTNSISSTSRKSLGSALT